MISLCTKLAEQVQFSAKQRCYLVFRGTESLCKPEQSHAPAPAAGDDYLPSKWLTCGFTS